MAIQFVPLVHAKQGYPLIDEVIALIKAEGLPCMVTPFNTVVEGSYEALARLQQRIYQHLDKQMQTGDEWLLNMQLHGAIGRSLYMHEKL